MDDITKKTKILLGDGIKARRSDEKPFSVLFLVSTMVGIKNTKMSTLAKN